MFLFVFLLVLGLPGLAARAQDDADDGPASVEIHNRDTYQAMPLKELTARTIIEGPLAKTRITYLAENTHTGRIEVTVNLHVPKDTVLTDFGYFYGKRFVPGKMYDKGEAWKIYGAVTSRGRDPGVMDRPSAQDYHAQIFPVEPKSDLRIVVELVQMLDTNEAGAHFVLPLTQGAGYGGAAQAALKPVAVDARVLVRDHVSDDLTSNAAQVMPERAAPGSVGEATERTATERAAGEGAALQLVGRFLPKRDWRVTIKRETNGLAKSVFSRLGPRPGEGYYALTLTAPRGMRRPRVVLSSRPGTSLSMPTTFGQTDAWDRIHVIGRYRGPETLYVSVYDDAKRRSRQTPLHLAVELSGARVRDVSENPAAALWADKRIAALQNAPRRNFKNEIIALSQRFMVVSNFTALLAIPKEELDYYKKVLAKQKVETNTRFTGGGGGDPYISVKAPADASQVVAVFPTGEVKSLEWDAAKGVWAGRFDIPWGTPAGAYRVTIIVVHANGARSRFVLEYQNLLSGPTVAASPRTTLRARPGEPVTVSVAGSGVQRAVAVAPWGERVELTPQDGAWKGRVTVPAAWSKGAALITVVLLDGAHNRTEVTLDLSVE